MTDKKNDIKLMLQVLIDNIDEFGSKFVTYKADSMKDLLGNTLEYIKNKEQEREELKKQLNQAKYLSGGVLRLYGEHQNIKYKQALDEIEKLIPKFDTSDGCSYGDYDCENCSSLDEDTVCTYKLKKIILDTINKVKEK